MGNILLSVLNSIQNGLLVVMAILWTAVILGVVFVVVVNVPLGIVFHKTIPDKYWDWIVAAKFEELENQAIQIYCAQNKVYEGVKKNKTLVIIPWNDYTYQPITTTGAEALSSDTEIEFIDVVDRKAVLNIMKDAVEAQLEDTVQHKCYWIRCRSYYCLV